MDLRNRYETSKNPALAVSSTGFKMPPEMNYLSQVDGEIIAEGLLANKRLQQLWKRRAIALVDEYKYKHSKLQDRIMKVKLKAIQEEIMTAHMLDYLLARDDSIVKKNNLIKSLDIYKHDKELTRDILCEIYHSQKGSRKFPYKAAYEFFMATGKEPYKFMNNDTVENHNRSFP